MSSFQTALTINPDSLDAKQGIEKVERAISGDADEESEDLELQSIDE